MRHDRLANCVAVHATAIRMAWVRQSNPTGKSLLIVGNHVKPQNKKYFSFSE
jgi:hypothetical protein